MNNSVSKMVNYKSNTLYEVLADVAAFEPFHSDWFFKINEEIA